MNYQCLLLEVEGPIAYLSLNRPDKLNALSGQLLQELIDASTWLNRQTGIRVVIIKGEGKCFSAGSDLQDATAKPSKEENWIDRRERGQLGRRMADAIEQIRAVTITQMHGYVIGGAFVLMCASDLRVAAEDTVFSIPEVDLGIPLAWGAIPRMVREIGPAMTRELVMTCRRFSAQEAKALGILNRVVPIETLAQTAEELARELSEKPSVPLFITKEHINAVAKDMVSSSLSFADGDGLLGVMSDPASQEAAIAYMQRKLGKKENRNP